MFIPGYIKIEERNSAIHLTNRFTNTQIKLENKYLEDIEMLIDGKEEKADPTVVSFLKNNGLLLDESSFQKTIDTISNELKKTLSIVIFTTEQRNFRCKYCYEEFKEGSMSKQQYDTIYDFIDYHLKNGDYDKLLINWFGGEPLLQFRDIIDFEERVLSLLKSKNIEFSANITTNGYLLTKERFEELLKAKVRTYQITIDGTKHDELRVLKDGSATKNTILTNIKNILDSSSEKFEIILRNNILRDNVDYGWYDKIAQIFGKDKRIFLHIHPVSPLGGDKELDLLDSDEEKEEQIKKHENYVKSIGLQVLDIDDVMPLCYASLPNNYSFRPNGEIVDCTVALKEGYNKIGSFNNGEIKIDRAIQKKWSSLINSEKCCRCINFINCKLNACPNNKFRSISCGYKDQYIISDKLGENIDDQIIS